MEPSEHLSAAFTTLRISQRCNAKPFLLLVVTERGTEKDVYRRMDRFLQNSLRLNQFGTTTTTTKRTQVMNKLSHLLTLSSWAGMAGGRLKLQERMDGRKEGGADLPINSRGGRSRRLPPQQPPLRHDPPHGDAHLRGAGRDGDPRRLQRLYLVRRLALAAADDGASVAHAAAGGRGQAWG
jgi:hypothetical protein